jgi:cytidylate kinase
MLTSINIAIDGFSSCGKSTLAKALAAKLKLKYVDTGAMYRAIALYLQNHKVIIPGKAFTEDDILPELDKIKVEFILNDQADKACIFLNGLPVETEIRNLEIATLASEVSKFRSVRNKLQLLQKDIAADKGVIMDGRDMGTVVIPNAELKIFMTADPHIRAQRRYKELIDLGRNVSLEDILIQQNKRDYDDIHRKEDPLRKANDALELDNSFMDEETQLNTVMQWVDMKLTQLKRS